MLNVVTLIVNIAIIFSLVFIGRPVSEFFTQRLNNQSLLILIVILLFIFISSFIFLLSWIKPKIFVYNKLQYFIILISFILLSLLIFSNKNNPAEAMHIILYASLSVTSSIFIFNALKNYSFLNFFSIILLCIIVSQIDELFQWFSYSRFGELNDIILNLKSSAISILTIFVICLRKIHFKTFKNSQITFYILITFANLLMLIFINLTPENTYKLAEYLNINPERSQKSGFKEGTIDYGYVHKVSDNIYLKSRCKSLNCYTDFDQFIFKNYGKVLESVPLNKSENLHWTVKINSFYKILNGNKTSKSSNLQRWKHSAFYENYIRNFSFNRNIEKAKKEKSASLSLLYSERAMLENYILQTLLPNAYKVLKLHPNSDDLIFLKKVIKKSNDSKSIDYSLVSKNLITSFTQIQLNIFFFITFIIISILLIIKIYIV